MTTMHRRDSTGWRRNESLVDMLLTLRKSILCLLLVVCVTAQAFATGLPSVAPAAVGMSAERLGEIDAVVGRAIERGETPGAVVLVARRGRIVWRKAYGSRAVVPAPRDDDGGHDF